MLRFEPTDINDTERSEYCTAKKETKKGSWIIPEHMFNHATQTV